MASINPTSPGTNQQLHGIVNTLPMPNRSGTTLADGTPFTLDPSGSFALGGAANDGFVITTGATPSPLPGATAASGTNGTNGSIVVGGGTTPAAGAQPPAPGTTTAAPGPAQAAATTPATTTTEPTTAGGPATVIEASGFGRADKNAPMRVDVGGAASFSFPSFNATRKTNSAPDVRWSPEWKRVEKNGMWYMEAPDGTKAVPAIEYRITPRPADKVQSIKVANGWGKKFPDGTILVFDRDKGPYRLDPKGNKHKVGLGTHTFGGVTVRVFEASVVRTLDKEGNVQVFDSRGNASAGSKRSRLAASLGAADAGASVSGGGKGAKTDAGPSTQGGGKPGTLVGGGKILTAEQLTGDVQHLTEVARGILDEVRSGTVDPVRLASLQAQLNALPSGILQAAGAAGTMASDGHALRHGGEDHAASGAGAADPTKVGGASGVGAPAPAGSTAPPSQGSSDDGMPPVPGTTTASGGGDAGSNDGTTAPVAGRDANATKRQLAAGARAKLDITVPSEFHGKQARFGQLPAELQEAVARAYGSNQGAGAFGADQLVAFTASGEVSLVEPGTVYLRRQAQVRGAGPGEDLALTVKPGRQPGGAARTAAVTGGGATTGTPRSANGGDHGDHGTGTTVSMPGTPPNTSVVTVGGGAPMSGESIELFKPGGEMRHVDLGGINGSFTWKTLPAKARAAILDFLRTETNDPAAKAYASRSGTGWTFDPNTMIVVEAGFAQFVNGLMMTREQPAETTGGGPTTQPVGHDARRAPTNAGIGTVPAGTPPPAPAGGGGHRH